ncbi:FAD-binding oxidoreductase [Aquabacter sp. CN5-332]|uniref:FAD-binding oxidoreductase n=1 Tax=Aquabacter sp. CN5-332 TaxID=3156608 RepID=UPI0032B5AC96
MLLPATPDRAAAVLPGLPLRSAIAHGCGRSYGDVALNPGGTLIDMRSLDRFVAFDAGTGLLTCETGVTLADILAAISRPAPDGSGWLLPVMPGTRFVTVGGAIANDVHGKNAHHLGSFGCHVEALELARSDGARLWCSRTENSDLFAATIGGLGLTGLILTATLRLRHVAGLGVETEDIRFARLDDFFTLDAESADGWEYTAAWIDCLASGDDLGRGLYMRARHAPGVSAAPPSRTPKLSVPVTPPLSLVNGLSVRAFNAMYWRKLGPSGRKSGVGSYEKVFFPLDAIGGWNRLYGPAGFYQFQAVVPPRDARAVTAALLSAIAAAGQGSMLVVLKRFGDVRSPGLMSFPMPGITLALDFPNRDAATLGLLSRLDAIVMEAGGRIYPAKDFSMSRGSFTQGYPALSVFERHLDPVMSSAFARRMGITEGEGIS